MCQILSTSVTGQRPTYILGNELIVFTDQIVTSVPYVTYKIFHIFPDFMKCGNPFIKKNLEEPIITHILNIKYCGMDYCYPDDEWQVYTNIKQRTAKWFNFFVEILLLPVVY